MAEESVVKTVRARPVRLIADEIKPAREDAGMILRQLYLYPDVLIAKMQVREHINIERDRAQPYRSRSINLVAEVIDNWSVYERFVACKELRVGAVIDDKVRDAHFKFRDQGLNDISVRPTTEPAKA